MSRILDALRRGRAPTPSSGGRTAHADAVLAALGYKSDRPRRSNRTVVLVLILLTAVGISVWYRRSAAGTLKPPAAVALKTQTHAEAQQAPDTSRREVMHTASALAHTEPRPVPDAHKPAEPNPPSTHAAAKSIRALPRPMPAPPPTPANPPPALVPDEFKLALYYQRTGDFEQALVHYKTVLQRDEMNANAHNNVGNLYMSKALYDEAAREFRRVLAIEPRYVTAHVNLAAALFQLKRYDESAAEARAAIRLDGRNADAYVNLALAQAAAGQTLDARSSLTRALEIDKHHAAAHYNLALQYEKAGEIALALDHYRAFLQYVGLEQTGYAAAVRSRVQALERR
ncbi:MAG TPA: tetratricopeptide repeat protein [Vicinamibacterales bacterium]|nr:tetratricopeptide repeat protein [Vicinamibacterales bacterium]